MSFDFKDLKYNLPRITREVLLDMVNSSMQLFGIFSGLVSTASSFSKSPLFIAFSVSVEETNQSSIRGEIVAN